MKALTIRQPWAFAICRLGKRVENRSWSTNHRGPILIHAAAGCGKAEMGLSLREIQRAMSDPEARSRALGPVFAREAMGAPRGAIVALATLGSALLPAFDGRARDPWHMPNQYGLRLSDVLVLDRPIPCKGRLGLWDVPAEIVAQVRAQIGGAS